MTDTTLKSLPDTDTPDTDASGTADRVREAATHAQEKVTAAATKTVESAKDKPYAAAGIVAGVAVAAAGVAYGVAKLREDKPALCKGPAKKAPAKK
ncbi:hypothetical protein AB5I41_25475 [Sphingomonas sp. MMS24-JH45]